MRKMNNLEYSFIVQELSSLTGKHFGRIRKLGEAVYRLKIGSTELLCELGTRIHKTKYIEEAEPNDRFVQRLTKELDNAKLLSVEQINNDRIISFNFDKGNLVFEMFGYANAILVKDGKIIFAYKNKSWSDREIKLGLEYLTPKKPKTKLEVSDRYIIVSMVKLPIGKEYCLEALARLGIDEKTPGDKLSKAKLAKLESELENLRKSAKPYIFYQNGKIVDFGLTELSQYSDLKEAPSLSEALDEYYAAIEKPDERLEKLVRRLEKQKERLHSLIEEEKENKMKGNYLYEHYAEIEKILELAKAGKFEEIEKKYKGKINKKEKSIEVDV